MNALLLAAALSLDPAAAERFASLALACVHKEYPNKIALDGIASGLPKTDPRVKTLMAASQAHARAGLASVTGEHYEGGHWLGSFATYLVTRRGVAPVIPSEVEGPPAEAR